MDRDQQFQVDVDKLIYRLMTVKYKSHQIPSEKLDTMHRCIRTMDMIVEKLQNDEGISMIDGIVKVDWNSVQRSRLSFRSIVASWKRFRGNL